MTVTQMILKVIADEERRNGEPLSELAITQSTFTKLQAEVECGCLLESHGDDVTFNGVKLVIVD